MIINGKKLCSKCQIEQTVECFHRSAHGKGDGLNPWCKDCRRAYSREHAAAYRPRRRETARRLYHYGGGRERRQAYQQLHRTELSAKAKERRRHHGMLPKPVLADLGRLMTYTASRIRNNNSRRKGHRWRTIPCIITRQYLLDLWHRQGGVDFYTHLPLALDLPPGDPDSPSIDRIDSSKGYTPGNVCWTAVWVNRAKGTMTPDQLRARLFPKK